MIEDKFNFDGVLGGYTALKKRLSDQGFEISDSSESQVKKYLLDMFAGGKYNGHVNYRIDTFHGQVFLQGVPRSGSPKECSFQLRRI